MDQLTDHQVRQLLQQLQSGGGAARKEGKSKSRRAPSVSSSSSDSDDGGSYSLSSASSRSRSRERTIKKETKVDKPPKAAPSVAASNPTPGLESDVTKKYTAALVDMRVRELCGAKGVRVRSRGKNQKKPTP